ncbi:MAG TPA: cytidine deaminase [Acidobacteriota bacterium]|nr:cytidine deaminase [Acidobacteriota bacterium]
MKKKIARTAGWKKAIARLPKIIRADVDALWENGGRLPADQVGDLLRRTNAEIGTLMMQLLPVAQQYAVVPVSHYQVGAVAAGMPVSGTGWCSLYLGANFEFDNVALSFTVHAEQSATTNAWLNGEPGMQALAISAAPCGYCRQFLYELVTAQQLNILLPSDPKNPFAYTAAPLTTFLPQAFGPSDLGVQGGMMDPKLCTHTLALNGGTPSDPVVAAALAAASGSYAPYQTDASYQFSGVAVLTADGKIYPGRYAENAAYNPSMSPLESALTFMNLSQPQGATRQITRCVLVEVPTLASQLSATQAVLSAYAPTVGLEYYTAKIVTGKTAKRAR